VSESEAMEDQDDQKESQEVVTLEQWSDQKE
jgi:hypothetical protein